MSRPQTPQHETTDTGVEAATVPISTQPFISNDSFTSPHLAVPPTTFSSSIPAQVSTSAFSPGIYPPSAYSRVGLPEIVTSIPTVSTTHISAPPLPSSAGPSRQKRRGKSHVASACINCKRAHLSCDVERPCRRCLDTGKEDSCHDVQHKKRGRPRLREEPGSTAAASSSQQTIDFQQQTTNRPIANTRHRRTDSYRSHQSRESESSSYGLISPMGPSISTTSIEQPSITTFTQTAPVCILNLDLHVLRVNESFRRMFDIPESVIGHHIDELVSPIHQRETFSNIRNRIRREREQREPAYLPPILEQDNDPLYAVQDEELLRRLQGSPFSEHDWVPRHARGNNAPIHVSLWLVKATCYFVVVTISVPSPSQQSMQPPMQHRSTASITTASRPSFFPQASQPISQQQQRGVYQMSGSSRPSYVVASSEPGVLYPDLRTQRETTQDTPHVYNDTTATGLWLPPASTAVQTESMYPPYATIPTTSIMPHLGPAFPASPLPQQQPQTPLPEPRLDELVQQDDDRSGSEAPTAKRRRKIDIDEVVE